MTLTVISASRVSYMRIRPLVAGNASPIRISTGTAVQMISSLVLWVNSLSGTAPLDLRNLNMA